MDRETKTIIRWIIVIGIVLVAVNLIQEVVVAIRSAPFLLFVGILITSACIGIGAAIGEFTGANQNRCKSAGLLVGIISSLVVGTELYYARMGHTHDIFSAAEHGTIHDVELCIKGGADVNSRSLGFTPLHYAAMHNNDVEVLKYLLSHGADVNAENNDGLTSLDVASTEAKEIILREAGGMNGHPKSLSSASKTDEEDNKSRMDTQSEP